MCGIFGCIGKKMSTELVNICCDKLTHRGPDGRGIWQKDDVALAHRRLSILDLSENGKQPMSYNAERYWITFNGEIYNYLEIRNDLERLGHKFNSDSDTEVILASYSQWGSECVNRFNGMWAFAIYDQRDHSLFISRDRFGIKPLYYTMQNEAILFASEMKALTPCLEKIEVNQRMIDFFRMFHHYEFKKECLIKGINRFPAGCNGFFKNGNLRIVRYWNTLDHQMEVPADYEEQKEIFRDLFLDACRIRMRSDVPIGTSLSGGLDSSAVICAMSALAQNDSASLFQDDWQHAYVAGFNDSALDETKYAKMVTDYIGIGSTFINIDNILDEDKMLKQAYYLEELWMNSQIPQMQIYANERANGTVVSMDGHGADELFAGYGFNMQFAMLDAISDKDILDVAQIIREAEHIDESIGELDDWKKKRLIKARLRNEYEHLYRSIILRSDYVKHSNFKKLDNLSRSLCVETHDRILPTLLRNYDRDSMSAGVEIRMPFMDYRIVEFAMSIPWSSKMKNGFSKAIVRDSLSDIMPKEIVYRKDKKGFNAPIGEWIRKSSDVYLGIVNDTDFINSSVVRNPQRIKKELTQFIKNPNDSYLADFNRAQRLWLEINMYIWEKAMIKGGVGL